MISTMESSSTITASASSGLRASRAKTGRSFSCPFHFQQAVDRFCLLARQFRHPLCCSSRRRGKGNIQPVALKQGENALERGGLTSARPAGEDKQAFLDGRRDGEALFLFILNAAFLLDALNLLFQRQFPGRGNRSMIRMRSAALFSAL